LKPWVANLDLKFELELSPAPESHLFEQLSHFSWIASARLGSGVLRGAIRDGGSQRGKP